VEEGVMGLLYSEGKYLIAPLDWFYFIHLASYKKTNLSFWFYKLTRLDLVLLEEVEVQVEQS
jgi:hypothetical protein